MRLGAQGVKSCFSGRRSDGRECLTIKRAFVGSVLGDAANPYVAIGWNGYNTRARFPFEFGDELPHSRMTEQLWAEVYAQVSDRPGLPLILGEYENTSGYLAAAVTQCKSRGGGSFYRPHPHGPTPSSVHLAPWTLIEDSIDASSVCLTHHSTAGVMALIRGCPALRYDRESRTWPTAPPEPGPPIPAPPERAPPLPRRRPASRGWRAPSGSAISWAGRSPSALQSSPFPCPSGPASSPPASPPG